MRKLTLLISMLFLSLGMAWAQTATLEVSTNVAYPEYQYKIKNNGDNGGFWMGANTAPTRDYVASFAFFAAEGDNAYKIYSIDKKQWVSYNKETNSSNCKNFAVLVDSKDNANAWYITESYRRVDVYQMQPFDSEGNVRAQYMNWYQGVENGGGGYSYDDERTVGLWSDNAASDNGSGWVLVDVAPETVAEVADFENGAIYTFVTQRGWMGANTTANVISSAYSSNNIPAADVKRNNHNFQWTVYKSANNKYYLYNIGKGQFMGMQTENNAPIPFAETPAGLKMTFKKSGNTNYPIMFSIDNAGVVNHSTDRAYGLIYWADGWNNPNDEGSNHKVVKVGELDDATLSTIEDLVANYEETAMLKMPEAGKYYRIKAVAEWNDDAPYLGSKNSAANSGRAEFIANTDAYSIFLFDGTSLKSYASGHYLVSNSSFLGYNGEQATGSKIGFQEDTNVAGVYNISFNDGTRWLYVNQDNYTDAGSSAGNSNGYRFNIEEVTDLPVAQIGNTVYYTIAEAVEDVNAGETLTLFVNTDETFELPFGVTLDKNGHTADNVTVATPVAKIGDQGYATLAAAVKAASAGATITFVDNVNENVTLSKNVTIDGANFNYTGKMSANNALTVTVQNVNFVNGGFAKDNEGTSGTYTIKNCTFDGKGTYYYPVLAKNIGTLNVENCTVKDYQYGFLYVKKQSTKVSVKNVTVEGCPNYAVYFASGVTNASIEGLSVKNSKSGILWTSAGARTLKLSGCKFENVKTAINSNGGAYVVTANVQGVNNDFGTAVLSDNVKCVLAEDATLAATTAGLNVTTNIEGKEVAYQGGKYSVVVKRDPAGYVAYRADVTDKDDREGIAILLKEVYAKNSLVVKVYNGETLMFTCTRLDIDDEDKVMFPVDGNTTANVVLWGKESGSWINEIAVAPTELNVPNRIEIWADGVLVQNYTHESGTVLGTNLEKYLALECVKKYDAKVGENYYETLAAAVEAAQDGATVELRKNATGAGVVIDKSIAIDFGGNAYTFNGGAVGSSNTKSNGFQIMKENNVTLKNGILNVAEAAKGEFYILIQNYANLAVEGMNLDGTNLDKYSATDGDSYVLSNNSGTVNVAASTITANDEGNLAFALDACDKSGWGYALPEVTVAGDATVNGNVEVSATLNMNGTLNGAIVINGANGVVKGAEGLNVTSTVADYELVYADGAYSVVEKFYAAKVGEQKYETLAAAVEAAEAGATVVLLNDATGAGVVINKNLTIDFNGKTYTANAGVGSAGTQTLALQILKGNNVTLQNGTLTSEGENIKMLINNYADLTVNNMKLVDATDHILYVLSNNSGTVNIINGSVISSDAVALDACKYASYAAPTVNVAEGVTVNGNVEVSATLNMNGTLNGTIVINGAEGVVNGAEGLNVTAMDGYNVAYAGGAYTVVEKHYVAQVGGVQYETFAAAVAAAPAGGTVTLIDDATEAATVILTKNLTIDGAGKTFTGAIEFKKSNGTFTVKNVNFNGAGTRVYALKSQASTTSLTVEKCTATAYTYGFLYANKAIANVTVTDVTVKDVNYGVHSAYGTKVTLNNFVAENVKYGVMVQNYGTRNVVLNNCSFTGSENPLYIWERNQTNKITFNFQGVNEMVKADFCTSAMAVVNADAIAGTKVCGTLAEAVAAPDVAGETVALLRDVELSTFVTIGKSITLNLGEYDITRNGGTALYVNGDIEVAINGTGTVTGEQALWVANGLAKVYGGNFCGVAEAVYVQNTGKAEIYGGTFSSSEYDSFVLNKKDDSRETASITVYGGTFTGFNPANNAAEGAGTNFVAAGLMAVDNGDGTFGIAKANIKMGDSYYATLAEAIAAIGAGDVVIELLADAALDYGAREAYGTAETASVTILGNGHTLTLNQTNSDWSSFGLAAGKVVLDNMTIEKTGHGDTSGAWNKHAIIFSSPVEMNNVTVNNSVAVQAGATLNNVTINEANGYYGLWINGNGQAVTVNGGSITATNGGRGIKIADQYIDAPAQVTLTVNGTVFSTAKKAAVLVSSTAGAQITASNYNIDNVVEDNVNFVWVDEEWAQYFANVQVEGATKYQEGIEGFVAQRSNGASYKTLAAAIEAAAAGETITLIGNTEEDVTVSKNLTIEGADMQYTGVMTLNKVNVTVQNLNFVKGQISKSKNNNGGNVTIVDCNFDGQGMNSYAVNLARTGSVVIENVTAQNYGYGLLQLSHSNNELSIKDVKVVNTNYALKIDYSNGVTIDGLKVEDVKVAAIYNSNYGTKTYTITNSDFSGAIEAIKMWERNTTVYNTFVFAGGNTLGDATLSTSPYAIYKGVVAEVGTKKYLDLRVAFDKAQDGETVKMLEDVTLDTKTLATQNDGYAAIINVAGKAVTLDLNGKNITVDAAAADLAAAKGKMLLTVFHADTNGELTLTDNTADKAGAVVVNVNDATVYSVFASESQYSDKSESGKLTVNAGNYTTVGKVSNAMFFTDANEVITVNGGNFHCDGATTTASYPWMFNTYLNNEIHVTVNGGTFNVDVNHQHRPFEVYVPETLAVNANGDGTWTVVPAVAYITEMLGGTVHESGDLEHKVGYATLAAAVEAAVEDDYVTLLADATGAGVVINKGLTIDFGGHTYTVNKAVGSKGTETLGFQILKENYVTLTNGTLTSTDAVEGSNEIKMLVQNYANLTLEDMNLVDATDHILYALSNNSGATFLTRNTNITTDAVAFDSYCSKYYDAPTVYVETEGRIEGAIEKNDGATIAISSGTFTAEILPEWCAEYYAPVQNADGTWTVEYRYIDELTIVDGDYTEFVNEREMTVGTLTYERDFTGFEGWQTLFVPFEIPVEQLTALGYEVAYFYDVHYEVSDEVINPKTISKVHFIVVKQGTLRANFPYVIKRTSEADHLLSVTLYDAKLYSTAASELNTVESSSTTTRFVFAGTYKKMGRVALTGDDNTPCYRFNPKGQVQKMSATANLVPFRVCMYIKAKDGSPVIFDDATAPEYIKMRIIGEENEDGTTTIYDVNAEEAEEMIFDLSGRRVLETENGIYIKNGKKVYVK